MLIYTDLDDSGEEKLLGRALIWEETYIKHPDKEDEMIIFMDRIYYNETHLEETFKKYAWDNGWWCKVQQSYMNRKGIANGTDEMDAKMYVKLTKNYYNELTPYLDTFAYMKEATGTIWNYEIHSTHKTLTDTEGNLSDDDCDYCGGDGQYDCESCEDGSIECESCEDGSIECEECEGNYESVRCSHCNATGVCRECNGTLKKRCGDCFGTSSTLIYRGHFINIVDDLLTDKGKHPDDVRTIVDEFRDKLLQKSVAEYKNITIDFLKQYDITADAIEKYDNKCIYCTDGYNVCACKKGACGRCDGNKTHICSYCEEGIAVCGDCEGETTINCSDCNGRGYIYCYEC
jgi:hypothetical protein